LNLFSIYQDTAVVVVDTVDIAVAVDMLSAVVGIIASQQDTAAAVSNNCCYR